MSILKEIDPEKVQVDNSDIINLINEILTQKGKHIKNIVYYYPSTTKNKLEVIFARDDLIKEILEISRYVHNKEKRVYDAYTIDYELIYDIDNKIVGMLAIAYDINYENDIEYDKAVLKSAYVIFHRNIGYSTLQKINSLIIGQLNKDEALQTIVNLVTRIGNYKVGLLCLVENGQIRAKTISEEIVSVNIALKLLGDKFANFEISLKEATSLIAKSIRENKIIIGDQFHEFVSPPAPLVATKIGQKIVGVKKFIAVPIVEGGIVVGCLNIASKNDFANNEIFQLQNYADQIAITLKNNRLFELRQQQIYNLEEKNKDLASLYNLSSRVSTSLDPLIVAQNAVDSLPQDDTMLGAIITEHNVSENKLEIITLTQNNIAQKVSGIIGDIKKYTTDLNDPNYAPTLTYRAFMMQEPQFSDDLSIYLHPPVPKTLIKPVQKIVGVKSVAVYPLKMRNKTIGTVAFLIKNRTVAEMDDNQKRLLQTFTTQISIALDNARLFKTAEETKRNLEQALIDLQEVRRRERDMIDIMGHELRTPLSIARNSLSMLNMELEMKGEISLDKQKKYVAIGLDAARREADLVETLLSATKVEGKGFQLTFEKVDLKNVIDISLIEFKRQADSKGLELILEDPEVPVFVYADKTRIQEIADNLIGNAIKYTPEGSVTISLSQKDNLGWLHVKDTGFGIAKADLRNLGKKFFRAKQYTKHANEAIDIIRPGGTGLGLFVSFALVKVMDGTYSVESELGEGSTFSFGLPLYSNQPIKQVERKIEDYLQSDEQADNVVEDDFSKS